jgi:hypothetical protein
MLTRREKNWMLLAVPLVGPCHSIHIFDEFGRANDRVSAHAYFLFFLIFYHMSFFIQKYFYFNSQNSKIRRTNPAHNNI